MREWCGGVLSAVAWACGALVEGVCFCVSEGVSEGVSGSAECRGRTC